MRKMVSHACSALRSGLAFCLRKTCGVRKVKKSYDYFGLHCRGRVMSKKKRKTSKTVSGTIITRIITAPWVNYP